MSTKSTETTKTAPSKTLTNTLIIPKLATIKTPECPRRSLLVPSQIPETDKPSNSYSDAICFCCLSTNHPVINATKCKHNNYLKTYYKINPETYICVKCHHTLKKIEAFRIQVNESSSLLNKCDFLKSQPGSHRMKVNNLNTTPVSVLTYDGSNIINTDVKTECQNVEAIFVNEFQEDIKQSDIKMEPESESEYETQPHTHNTQKYIVTHKLYITPTVSTILKTQNYTETQENDIKPTPLTQNNTPLQIKLVPITQNNTKTQEKVIKTKPPTQKYTETKEKHTTLTQNNTETQIKPTTLTKNNTETQIKPTPLTQNNTETQIKHTQFTISTRPKNKTPDKIYTGKIRFVTLTEQELLQERHRLENDEVYLKLQYKCESCIKGYNHCITLKKHNEKHHPQFSDPLLTCGICKCVHTNKTQYNAHNKAHYKRFECVACNKRTGDLPTLAYHYNTAHSNTDRQLYSPIPLQYNCQDCAYTTDSHRRYRYHKQKHKARTVCELCNKAFICQSAYNRHIMYSHRFTTKSYKCEQCPRTYKMKNNLTTHMRAVHSEVKVSWYCITCDFKYGCEATYKGHLKTSPNHVDLKFICNDCNKVFKRKITLRQHIEWEHLKIHKHKCVHCNKLYQTIGGLRSHVRSSHLNVKQPKNKICDYCGKLFSITKQLTSHIRTHTGERPLHCTHCEATFAHDGALYKHKQLVHQLYKTK